MLQYTCILAPNPGPMTLEGTNTYVIATKTAVITLDPGPEDQSHITNVAQHVTATAAAYAQTPEIIVVLSHHHADHIDGLPLLLSTLKAKQLQVRVVAADPLLVVGAEAISDDADLGGLRVVHTPGHTSDSLCLLAASGELFTGDTILGRGTTIVAYPDGRLGPYLASLRRIATLVNNGAVRKILPAHGPEVTETPTAVANYLAHRADRLEQVVALLAQHRVTARQVLVDAALLDAMVASIYAPIEPHGQPELFRAARLSLQAQLDYLAEYSGSTATSVPHL